MAIMAAYMLSATRLVPSPLAPPVNGDGDGFGPEPGRVAFDTFTTGATSTPPTGAQSLKASAAISDCIKN